jgi:GAF domain-containing protein
MGTVLLESPIPQQPDGRAVPCRTARQMAAVTPLTCSDDGSVLSVGALAEAMRSALSNQSPSGSLQMVIELAVETAPCDQASITALGPARTVQTIASSDDRVSKADLVQYQLGQGPALDAAESDELITVEDLTTEHRWPRWAPLAAGFGIGSLLSVRLYTDTPLGVINLYSQRPRDYDDPDLEAARVIAAHASVILAHHRSTENVRRAIDTHTLIGQARGILLAQHSLTPDAAFAVLRLYAQTTNTTIAELAQELTHTGQLPHPDQQNNPPWP